MAVPCLASPTIIRCSLYHVTVLFFQEFPGVTRATIAPRLFINSEEEEAFSPWCRVVILPRDCDCVILFLIGARLSFFFVTV